MNYNELFPSNFIAASDLAGRDVPLVVAAIKREEVGTDKELRGVLYFVGAKKGMVLNRTNGKRIAALYGDNTDAWIGKPVTLYPSETEFGGETVPCIRVRKEPPAAVAVQPASPPVPTGPGF